MYNSKFKNPSAFLIAGGSQSGKTTLTLQILSDIDVLFEDPTCKQNVIYYYNQWQPSFDKFRKKNIVKEWINKIPTTEEMKRKTLLYTKKGGSIIVIDDFAERINKDTIEIFSILSHHTNTVVFLLTQNLFSKNRNFRDISLNCTYVILFKNPRDGSQIARFASQFRPGKGNSEVIIEAFRDATREPYSYVLFDFHQTTNDKLRIRTKLVPDDFPVTVYAYD